MKRIDHATIEKHSRVDPIKHKNYVCLRSEDGVFFYTEKGDVRSWKTPGGAKAFLRRISDIYNVAYIVTNLTGSTSLINITRQELIMMKNLEEYGSHVWRKVNASTIDDGFGMYDLWRCELCKLEMKRFGLAGRPSEDYCPAHHLKGDEQ